MQCDWLSAKQVHVLPGAEPCKFIAGAVTHRLDHETGEMTKSITPKRIQGKHGSSCQVSSDGYTVTYSGNPSRWNRPHSLDGLTVDAAMQLVNEIIVSLGLPAFCDGPQLQYVHDNRVVTVDTSAQIQEIHICRDLQAGDRHAASAMLKHQSTLGYPRLKKHLWLDTVYYGFESESKKLRIYDKGQQGLATLHKLPIEDREEIEQLWKWAISVGLIRQEVEFKRLTLRRAKQHTWSNLNHKKMEALMTKAVEPLAGETTTNLESISDIPWPYQGTLYAYMAGVDLKRSMSTSAFSRHKSKLLKYGFDISNQQVHLLEPQLRVITLRPAELPEIYRARAKPISVKK